MLVTRRVRLYFPLLHIVQSSSTSTIVPLGNNNTFAQGVIGRVHRLFPQNNCLTWLRHVFFSSPGVSLVPYNYSVVPV